MQAWNPSIWGGIPGNDSGNTVLVSALRLLHSRYWIPAWVRSSKSWSRERSGRNEICQLLHCARCVLSASCTSPHLISKSLGSRQSSYFHFVAWKLNKTKETQKDDVYGREWLLNQMTSDFVHKAYKAVKAELLFILFAISYGELLLHFHLPNVQLNLNGI